MEPDQLASLEVRVLESTPCNAQDESTLILIYEIGYKVVLHCGLQKELIIIIIYKDKSIIMCGCILLTLYLLAVNIVVC